jgi:uncharacterized protein (DUF58 family)
VKLATSIRRLLDRLRLPVPARATAARQGGHRSPVLATGLEPADHRMYVPGDDVRRIDWNAFARLRQLTVRQFEEERDARVYVMLDCSGSMTRGEPPKIEAARTLAASFAYLAMKQFDTVRVLPFRADAGAPSPALRTRDRLPQLERFLGDIDAAGLTSFPEAVRAFARQTRGRGLVVLITDLMTPNGWEEGFRVLGGLGHQVTVVRVGCAEDDRPDLRGEIELVDAESGERLRIRSSKELLRAYRETVKAHLERCRGAVVRAGGRIVTADAETPPERLVRDVIGLAGKRQRGAA